MQITDRQAEAVKIADAIVARAEKGVPSGRHIHDAEELPLIEAYRVMRAAAIAACEALQHAKDRATD